ncbi:cellobiose ABC transporter membrane protein [Sediminihabitans luteus]|uniref:Cellobiose ABC transporter membrane protein n=1 Tax=Sediminihabitans luteus TaxID=1138585 RepID=A0A2M9CDK7_9CELL|nr:carbohydrate ABC transporter permease [Sediminihabitans luteus]PJJ69958.1 cellobiose ABC transporter membrane protein [Sediminihabitans luteus]GII99278.1 sugar ABC transporter permease [Sediminihabitans luteus]
MSSIPVIANTAGPGAARAARRRASQSFGSTQRRPRWVTYTILGIVLLISVFPLYFTLMLGSSTQTEISQSIVPQWFPDLSIFDRFGDIITSGAFNFPKALLNSIIISTVAAASTVLFSTMAGYAFAKLRFRGRRALLVFVIATTAVPTQLGVIPLYIVMAKVGWIDTIQAVLLPVLVSAFGVFWMTQYLENALPYELIEAARVDGASMFRTFWSIALPAARPAAAMLALFTFVQQWTNFFWPSIVLSQDNATLPVIVKLLQGNYHTDYSLVMAGVFLTTVPLLIVFAFTGRQLVAGIMQGAVKG